MQRILIIDASYFGQRVLGQVNMGDSVNNLETPEEQEVFKYALRNSLVNLYRTFNNNEYDLIDQIIFACDCGSWRKDVEPFRPYFIPKDSDTVIGYKEQRKAVKEESPINYDNFYSLLNEFIEDIRNTVVVIKINKLEADDIIMLLANRLKKLPDTFSVVFATDGDLDQVVKDNVILMRNIRSKNAPNGEYVINLNLYSKIFERTAMETLLGSTFDTQYYQNLFSVMIGNIEGGDKVKRELNRGISISTPFRTALVKSVAGDKKDNIFSLISWMSSTGTRQYKITEKHIEKALDRHGFALTEENCQKILVSKDALVNLMLALREVTKQMNTDIKELARHLKHNLRMNMLIPSNVPSELISEFDTCWDSFREEILDKQINKEEIMKLQTIVNHNPKANSKNVLEESIPEL